MKTKNFELYNEKRKILIVDDEEINRALLEIILSEKYETISATNGREALDIIKKEGDNISLVLLDIMMPELDGISVLKQLRSKVNIDEIPVIVLTSDAHAEELSLELGAVDFISKPYPPKEIILARIKRTIELYYDRKLINYTERDVLTGLYNMQYFYQYALYMDQKYEEDMDAIVLDIHHFHILNERFGKKHCDKLLKKVATNLKMIISNSAGIVCRNEADTFFIYVKHKENYDDILKDINSLDEKLRFRMGIYQCVDKNLEISQRFDRANHACNMIRDSLTKHIMIYDKKIYEEELFEENLIDSFKKALENDEFIIFYQPKFNVSKDVPFLNSAEALVRWKHPKIGLVSPGIFIPLFERNGLIEQLDYYIWKKVAKDMKEWLGKYNYTVPISVNVSRIDMYNHNLAYVFKDIISEYGIDSSNILLEITESAYADDETQIIEMVKELRSEGFKIEMDDFGTGYSSLNMIARLPIDVLKIDKSFVKNASEYPSDIKVLEVIIDIAKYLNVPVIAEGVETQEQFDLIKKLGCDIIQGFYFSKPIPKEEFEKYIIERKENL